MFHTIRSQGAIICGYMHACTRSLSPCQLVKITDFSSCVSKWGKSGKNMDSLPATQYGLSSNNINIITWYRLGCRTQRCTLWYFSFTIVLSIVELVHGFNNNLVHAMHCWDNYLCVRVIGMELRNSLLQFHFWRKGDYNTLLCFALLCSYSCSLEIERDSKM